jgi:hypothetical protein
MTQLQNQFKQSVEKGQVDQRMGPGTISCQVKSDEATALVPGQAVKIVDSAGGVPKVTAVTADTDDIFGVVAFTFKDMDFPAGAPVEIVAMRNGVIYMEAGAAIARNAEVQYVVTGQKVITAVSTKRILGRAFDKAANGEIFRVVVDLPGIIKA